MEHGRILIVLALLVAILDINCFQQATRHISLVGLPRTKLSMLKCTNTVTSNLEMKENAKIRKDFVQKPLINLCKGIIGTGAFSIPYAQSQFSTSQSLLPIGVLTCGGLGQVASYTFESITNQCKTHNATSYRDVWAKSVSPNTAILVSSFVIAKCFITAVSYLMILGDSISSLVSSLHIPSVFSDKSWIIGIISTLFIYPLSMLPTMEKLAPFSMVGLIGTIFSAIFITVRYLGIHPSYSAATNILESTNMFKSLQQANISGFLMLISILSASFIAHFNAPKFGIENSNLSVKENSFVIRAAFVAASVLYTWIMSTGFLTFGGLCMPYILNNYATTDIFANIARLMVSVSVVTSFPHVFMALADNVSDTLASESVQNSGPVSLLRKYMKEILFALIVGASIFMKDLGKVTNIGGALFGSFIMLIAPAIMNISVALRSSKGSNFDVKAHFKDFGVLALGIVTSIYGIIAAFTS